MDSWPFKNWFKKNIQKITLALATIGAVTGTIGLIVASVTNHQVNNGLIYFLDHNKQAVWGSSTIWQKDIGGQHKIALYFDIVKHNSSDIKWDGTYPEGYFNS